MPDTYRPLVGAEGVEIGVEDGALVVKTAHAERARIDSKGSATGVFGGGGGGSVTPSLSDVLVVGNDAGGHALANVANPTNPQDAATKASAQAQADAAEAAAKQYVDVLPTSQVTGTAYSPALSDLGAVKEFTSTDPVTVTIQPDSSVNFPVGGGLELVDIGGGGITVAPGAGVTVDSLDDALVSGGQFSTLVLRKRAANEWVLGGELATARVKDLLELQLSSLGLVSANFTPSVAQGITSSPVSESLYGLRIGLRKGMRVSGLMLHILTAAVGTAPTGAYVGLIDPSNKVVVQSGNLAASSGWTTQGFQTFSFGSTYTVPADGAYAAFLLINGTWGTTQPIMLRNGGAMLDDVRFDFRQGGLTAPPANGSPVTPGASAILHFWVGCVGT